MIYRTIYQRLQKIGIIDPSGKPAFKDHVKIENTPYMPLSVDFLRQNPDGSYVISIAHNFVQNGDLMADPDMEIKIYPEPLGGAEALTYQMDSMGIYQQVYPEPGKYIPRLRKDLNSFLSKWTNNLIHQGFTFSKGMPE